MQTEIVPFVFNGAEVRAMSLDTQAQFIAKDVCDILGIEKYRDAISRLDDDEKGRPVEVDTPGGSQLMATITESGLYTLVLRCRDAMTSGTPAHQFRKWVTSEVLPAIRKTGGYQMPATYPEALRLYADKFEEAEKLKLTVSAQQPAVEYIERYVKADGLFGIREAAKILGLQQKAFVQLCEGKVLFRENGTLQPYAQWLEAGYFAIKTGEANEHAFKQTRFTSRGLEWVRRYLNLGALLSTGQEAREAA